MRHIWQSVSSPGDKNSSDGRHDVVFFYKAQRRFRLCRVGESAETNDDGDEGITKVKGVGKCCL